MVAGQRVSSYSSVADERSSNIANRSGLQIISTKEQKMVSWTPQKGGQCCQLNMNWNQAVDPTYQQEGRCELCPLSRVKAGVAVRIKQLCAVPELQNRLRELGFCEDQIIRLLTSQTNFICQVCNTRLAISEQLARIIMVEPVRA